MIFHSLEFLAFFVLTLAGYWAMPMRAQNVLILVASYVFYGWVHPWFLVLIFATTLIDFGSARGMTHRPDRRKVFLWLSIITNFGLLGFYKYFGFFVAVSAFSATVAPGPNASDNAFASSVTALFTVSIPLIVGETVIDFVPEPWQ